MVSLHKAEECTDYIVNIKMKATGEQKFPVGTVYHIQYKVSFHFSQTFDLFGVSLIRQDRQRVINHYGNSRENIPTYTLISSFVSSLGKRGIFHFSNPAN